MTVGSAGACLISWDGEKRRAMRAREGKEAEIVSDGDKEHVVKHHIPIAVCGYARVWGCVCMCMHAYLWRAGSERRKGVSVSTFVELETFD